MKLNQMLSAQAVDEILLMGAVNTQRQEFERAWQQRIDRERRELHEEKKNERDAK